MANREIQPPGGDLGVNEGGRGRIIDMLIGKRIFGGNDGGSRGKSKRDYKNEAKLLEHQYKLQDMLEQARTARHVEGTYNTNLNNLVNSARMLNAGAGGDGGPTGDPHDFGKIIPTHVRPDEFLAQDEAGNKIHIKDSGNRGPGPVVSDDPPTTDGPGPVVSDDPPITDGPGPKEPAKKRRTAADVRLDMKSAEDEYDAAVAAGASDEDLADLASRGSMLSDEHYLLARKEGGQRDKGARKKAGLPAAGGTAGYTFESLDGGANDSRVRSTKSRGETLKKLQANVDYGRESLGIGTVGNDGGIDLGENGVRPAPSGESGVIEGTQFSG